MELRNSGREKAEVKIMTEKAGRCSGFPRIARGRGVIHHPLIFLIS
jgi:hypothetical protein